MISIAGLDKAAVLAALYNRSRPQGLEFLHYNPEPMSLEEAKAILEKTTVFDYLHGRVMKVSLATDEFNEALYDRDNGNGAAASAIAEVRAGRTVSEKLQSEHEASKREAANDLVDAMNTKTTITKDVDTSIGKATQVTVGLSDVASLLKPAVKKATEQ